MVASLVRAGADVNRQRRGGFSPVYVAAQHGHCEVLRYLLVGYANGLGPDGKPLHDSDDDSSDDFDKDEFDPGRGPGGVGVGAGGFGHRRGSRARGNSSFDATSAVAEALDQGAAGGGGFLAAKLRRQSVMHRRGTAYSPGATHLAVSGCYLAASEANTAVASLVWNVSR